MRAVQEAYNEASVERFNVINELNSEKRVLDAVGDDEQEEYGGRRLA